MLNEPSDPRNDQDLIAAITAGDTEAFAVLYRRHRDWVVGLAYRFTGDRDLALDVLQESFLYFLRKFPGFQLTCQLRSFLYPAVRNLAIAARRKAERCQSDGTDLEDLPAPASADASSGATGRDELAAVMAGLSADHREVLLLRFVDGLSWNEIADAMDVPLGTVKSRLHNALDILRRQEPTKRFFEA